MAYPIVGEDIQTKLGDGKSFLKIFIVHGHDNEEWFRLLLDL